jgi:hypothetical protein
MSTGGEVANALVCKTSIRGFDPHPVLQNPLFQYAISLPQILTSHALRFSHTPCDYRIVTESFRSPLQSYKGNPCPWRALHVDCSPRA